MIDRRELLRVLGGIPFLGGMASTAVMGSIVEQSWLRPIIGRERDLFKELGLRTFINCAGPFTSMTGCLMPDEVLDAIKRTGQDYVDLNALHDRVGERIAKLLECEGAVVSSGCFGAMSIGVAGVMTGTDREKIQQLPNTEGMKDEIIVQESHAGGYSHALTNIGAKLVTVKTAADVDLAVNDKTAMMWFLNKANNKGELDDKAWVALGEKHNIPTFNDCASDIPPLDNLFRFTRMGFDLVAFSGGKGLRGPQSAGLLLGKKKYTDAARLNAPPSVNIGRGMKVNKEEIIGMLIALEIYLAKDHGEEWKMWEAQIALIKEAVDSVDGITSEVYLPEIANEVPTLLVTWDQEGGHATYAEVRKKLRMGHPAIEIWPHDTDMQITTWMMEPGQERAVAYRVKEVLAEALS
ncbi:MAG: selenocysteine synthase [Saprospiraceae bacterium]|nr:selenocysteine synthase [Saprospiraceae bacterium]